MRRNRREMYCTGCWKLIGEDGMHLEVMRLGVPGPPEYWHESCRELEEATRPEQRRGASLVF